MLTRIGNLIKTWTPALLIGMSAFIYETSELMPVGLLPEIAGGIGRSEATTGLLVTGYAWIVMLFSLPLTLASASMNRRKLLLILLGVFAAGNVLCAIAGSFSSLFLARIVIAGTHCIFWAVTPPLAARLSPEGKSGVGLAIVGGCATLAAVLGVPFGTFIGQQFGWRLAFGFIGGLAFLAGAILFFLLPTLPSIQTGNWKSLPSIIRNKNLMAAFAVVVFIVSGQFVFYTYFVPYLHTIFHIQEDGAVLILLIFGLSGGAGILLAGVFATKHLRFLLIAASSVVVLMMLAVRLSQSSFAISLASLIVWGVAFSVVALCFQVWVLELSPDAKDAATALYSGIFNFGIGGGALYGSIALRHTHVGNLPLIASIFVLPGIALVFHFARNPRRPPA